MARYTATVDSPKPQDEVFAYLSDFTTAAEWDPGTLQSDRIDEGPLCEGSAFRLVAQFLGRKTTLTYRIVEFQPPSAVTLLGENSTVLSRDRITFAPHGEGTRVLYDADLTLKGALRFLDPLLALAFRRVGDQALAGMRRSLGAPQTDS